MFRLSLLITLFLSSLSADFYDLKPIKITKEITCVIGDFNPPKKSNNGFVSNMCYVDMGNSLVVLDAGPTYIFAKEFHTLMQNEYKNKKVSHVVLSNYHDDRVQGASYFKDLGAKIVAHTTLNSDIKENPNKFLRMGMLLDPEVLIGTKVIDADTLVENGYKIKGSKKTLEILKFSKSSEEKSDIAIYSKDDSFVFTGNIIFNGRMLNYTKHSNIDGWIKTIESIVALKPKYILGGHGKEYDKDSYKFSLQYLKVLKEGVTKAYEDELDLMDIKQSFDTKQFEFMPYFSQLHSNNINNYYEQLEFGE
jgi:glyoxylase-like metal-dependent hydrolase (beta-lactamase superfamily II)